MPIAKESNITQDIVNDLIFEECKQPYLKDETECCLEQYGGCCCDCKFQLGVHADFPISSLYCYVCLFKLAGQVFINTTHGNCGHYKSKSEDDNTSRKNSRR